MRAFSVCNVEHPNLEVLEHTARQHGYDLEVIGRDYGKDGTPWYNSAKLRILKDRLARDDFPDPEEVVAFVDAFDSCFANGADELLRNFRSFDCDILYSASRFCFPSKSYAVCMRYPSEDRRSDRPYLNGGMALGKVWAWRKLLDAYDPTPFSKSEQALLHPMYVDPSRPVRMKLDHDGVCLLNVNYSKSGMHILARDEQGRAYCRDTKTYPGIVSSPGIHRMSRFHTFHNYLREAHPELDTDRIKRKSLKFTRRQKLPIHDVWNSAWWTGQGMGRALFVLAVALLAAATFLLLRAAKKV